MNLGREKEYQYLNEIYSADENRLVVLYGQKHIGKTTLITDFIRDKDYVYYLAGEASMRQQQYLMAQQFRRSGIEAGEYPSFAELMDHFAGSCSQKRVLVLDEFDHLIKCDPSFMEAIISLLESDTEGSFMILLCSSSVSFVENQMVSRIGRAALSISAFIKIRELSFAHTRRYFSKYSIEDVIAVYAILGGLPGLWKQFDPDKDLRTNICNVLLCKDSFLAKEGSSFVKEMVREGSVYYSILSALAQGKDKLGDIYMHTGFSRAKISVYLKNLMELEIVEKVSSLDTRGRDNQRKGIYRISNHFMDFWFCFLYPNASMNVFLSPESFYEQVISEHLEDYCKPYFSRIVHAYMEDVIMEDDFDFEVDEYGIFDGKEGYIDFLATDEDQSRSVCAFCCYDKPYMPYEFYEQALRTIDSAQVPTDLIYLFSREGFDEKITLEAKVRGGSIRLLSMRDWIDKE